MKRNLLLSLLLSTATLTHAAGIDVREPEHRFQAMRLPAAQDSTHAFATSLDRHLWVTQTRPARLVRVSPIGEMSSLKLPANSGPQAIVADASGNVWVALTTRQSIVHINAKSGAIIKEYPLTTAPIALALNLRGQALWYLSGTGNAVGKLSLDTGNIETTALPNPGTGARHIALDYDGNLWFSGTDSDQLGYLTPEGFIYEHTLPEGFGAPGPIVADPTRLRMWFGLERGGAFGSIDASGHIEMHRLPTPAARIACLAFDTRGLLWMSYAWPDKIATANPAGDVTEYPLPRANSRAGHIQLGPDGNIWFIERAGDRLVLTVDTAGYR